jgi:hypothetical protein
MVEPCGQDAFLRHGTAVMDAELSDSLAVDLIQTLKRASGRGLSATPVTTISPDNLDKVRDAGERPFRNSGPDVGDNSVSTWSAISNLGT